MMPPAKGERLPEAILGPFGAADVGRYADVSGDTNPIHVDAAAARTAGLAGPVVQGMLVMAHMVRIAEAWRSDAVIMTARALFVRPIGMDERLIVEGRVVQSGEVPTAWQCTLRITARNEAGAVAAIVEAQAAAVGPDAAAEGHDGAIPRYR